MLGSLGGSNPVSSKERFFIEAKSPPLSKSSSFSHDSLIEALSSLVPRAFISPSDPKGQTRIVYKPILFPARTSVKSLSPIIAIFLPVNISGEGLALAVDVARHFQSRPGELELFLVKNVNSKTGEIKFNRQKTKEQKKSSTYESNRPDLVKRLIEYKELNKIHMSLNCRSLLKI